MKQEEIKELKDYIDFQFSKNRDYPQDETTSKLFHSLDKKVEVILSRLDTQCEKMIEIHEQTSKTNGRVTKLEEWKNTMAGKLVMIGVFCTFISPFIFWFITKE